MSLLTSSIQHHTQSLFLTKSRATKLPKISASWNKRWCHASRHWAASFMVCSSWVRPHKRRLSNRLGTSKSWSPLKVNRLSLYTVSLAHWRLSSSSWRLITLLSSTSAFLPSPQVIYNQASKLMAVFHHSTPLRCVAAQTRPSQFICRRLLLMPPCRLRPLSQSTQTS